MYPNHLHVFTIFGCDFLHSNLQLVQCHQVVPASLGVQELPVQCSFDAFSAKSSQQGAATLANKEQCIAQLTVFPGAPVTPGDPWSPVIP